MENTSQPIVSPDIVDAETQVKNLAEVEAVWSKRERMRSVRERIRIRRRVRDNDRRLTWAIVIFFINGVVFDYHASLQALEFSNSQKALCTAALTRESIDASENQDLSNQMKRLVVRDSKNHDVWRALQIDYAQRRDASHALALEICPDGTRVPKANP